MSFEMNNNAGSLFKNQYKEEGDSKPHMTGTCKIDGITYRVAAWTNKDKYDQRFQSLKFTKIEDEE